MILPFAAPTEAPLMYIPNACKPCLSSIALSHRSCFDGPSRSGRRFFLLQGTDLGVFRVREAIRHIEIEDALGVEAEDVALRLLVQKRQVPDRARQVHVPVR